MRWLAARDRPGHRRAAATRATHRAASPLPQLVERSGNGKQRGVDHGLLHGAVRGDDQQDLIADAARGILDGQPIVLSRELAEAGHGPAIDVERSISRVMPSVAPQTSPHRLRASLPAAAGQIQQSARPDPARGLCPGPRPRAGSGRRDLHADSAWCSPQQDMHSPPLSSNRRSSCKAWSTAPGSWPESAEG